MRKTLETRKMKTERVTDMMLTKRSLSGRKESRLLLRKGRVVEEEKVAEIEETERREGRESWRKKRIDGWRRGTVDHFLARERVKWGQRGRGKGHCHLVWIPIIRAWG